jgi:hypothetical protein
MLMVLQDVDLSQGIRAMVKPIKQLKHKARSSDEESAKTLLIQELREYALSLRCKELTVTPMKDITIDELRMLFSRADQLST